MTGVCVCEGEQGATKARERSLERGGGGEGENREVLVVNAHPHTAQVTLGSTLTHTHVPESAPAPNTPARTCPPLRSWPIGR